MRIFSSMIYLRYFALIFLFWLNSCAPAKDEVSTSHLTASEQQLNPYKTGQKFIMVHSAGKEIEFTVLSRTVSQQKAEGKTSDGFNPGHFTHYSDHDVTLIESKEPKIIIRFEISSGYYFAYPTAGYDLLGRFVFPNPPGECVPDQEFSTTCLDSINIRGKWYYNVFKMGQYEATGSSPILASDSVYYNKEQGFLKIKLSDDETFTLKP